MNATTAGSQQKLMASNPQILLGGMLLALHAALAWGIDTIFSRAMLLVHFGIFLIWQPVWRGERNLDSRQAFLVVIVGLLLAGWNNWWLMAVWLAVLFALIGGNLFGIEQSRQRLAALLAALYLLTLLLVWVVPHLFTDQQYDTPVVVLVRYVLPVLLLAMIAIRVPVAVRASPLAVDLFYSLMLFLLVTGLVLGSFVVKQISHGDYSLALAQSLMVMGLVLVTLSWLWNPHTGFTGIGHLLSRYLMSLGLPFERWVKGLADLAERERDPARFLSLALHDMCELPWVAGLSWHAAHSSGELGARSRFQAEYAFQDLTLTFHTKWSLSPSLLLHLKLLTQMLGHFYEAKQREEVQRTNAYTQAIYETGARLTHDVKNLLQSLRSLCAAAETSSESEAAALQGLVKRQLPQIAQRLTVTLEKLQAPHQAAISPVSALSWWEGLKQRYTRGDITFAEYKPRADVVVPSELFDSVTENLLQNAIAKAQQDANTKITVTFDAAHGGCLTIRDSGAAVAKQVAAKLFSVPVPSRSGLGIGLYQAARQAEQAGYSLTLVNNEAGNVCFELRKIA
ncbi:MAG: ATP-binding region, ATPase-like protein [Betaproteobacteria bacterium]|nr:ATP-binding region, ATPase-like protein [Betaproteobacteria bacterium]